MSDQPMGIPNPATTEDVIEGRPWWKVCCIGCLFMAIVFVIAILIGLRLFTGSTSPQTLRSLPASFPQGVVLFRPEQNDSIVYYPASSKNKNFGIITQSVKLFGSEGDQLSTLLDTGLKSVKDTDTVTIHWSNMDAPADEIIRFYAGAMKQAGVGDPQMKQTSDATVRKMVGLTSRLSLQLLVVDLPDTETVDSITFVVEYPSLPNGQ